MIGFVELDGEFAAHLAKALTAHLRWTRANGIPAPVALQRLAEDAVKWAKAGLDGPGFARFGEWLDTQPCMVKLLTLPAAADLLGCSTSKVKRLIADGSLAAVDFAGTRRVRREDLDAYVAALGPAPFRERIQTKTARRTA